MMRRRSGPMLQWIRRAKRGGWLALILLTIAVWGGLARSSQARLQPYYVVSGSAFGDLRPRVMIVLDTSGSMGTTELGAVCDFSDCESPAAAGTAAESRMASARRAIREVIDASSDTVSFGLMTFGQNSAHSSTPNGCLVGGEVHRFVWVTDYAPFWSTAYSPIARDTGVNGIWRICQGGQKRPYPYVRWDELGVGSVISANNLGDAPLPASPLISVAPGDIDNPANALRRVQFFPEFMGVRINLNSTTDPDLDVLNGTYGDYDRATEVRNHDFYYWPYVDGFPGYGDWHSVPTFTGDSEALLGVAGPTVAFQASLYAPFYLELDGTGIAEELWGPASDEDALRDALEATSPLVEGGVDTGGYTPWRDAVGFAPATAVETNAVFSHTSISSYLKFATSSSAGGNACAPTSLILVTDGEPWPSDQGGPALYQRLSAVRRDLNIKTYVVGFLLEVVSLNDMACAAAGACSGEDIYSYPEGVGEYLTCNFYGPCRSTSVDDWDTCRVPGDPDNCSYSASSTSELAEILTELVGDAGESDVASGPGTTANNFGVGDPDGDYRDVVQTQVSAYTEYPSWRGHVIRGYCDDVNINGALEPYCDPPTPEFQEAIDTYGVCGQSRDWDAGECLQNTVWTDRLIYTHDAANNLVRIAEDDGTATATFQAILLGQGLISTADASSEADDIVAFILGRDAPSGWKLPGLSNSAPTVVRRIAPYRSDREPTVALNDPHCAGKRFSEANNNVVPDSLNDYAVEVWDDGSPYQDMVVVGDDMGVLHAFQYDSGNELWGFLPAALLPNVVAQSANGAQNMGQPSSVADHIYGISGTVNHGWVAEPTGATDADSSVWRHLGVFGFGPGGSEYAVIDFTHGNPDTGGPPFELLWTTEDAGLKAVYDPYLGETWARPALTYHVPNDEMSAEPIPYLVFGSGYGGDPVVDDRGRTLMLANALTGELVEWVVLPEITHPVYPAEFGAVVDPAVASHCISRYWAEMQEVYVADPAGRLFRWDQGRTSNHEADSRGIGSSSVAPWADGDGIADGDIAEPVTTFLACQGTGDTCSIGTSGDVFVYAPAVSSSDRIEDINTNNEIAESDEFLVALVSGSPYDDELDPQLELSDFHSSIYMLVDNHSSGSATQGFSIPAGAPKSAGGPIAEDTAFLDASGYMRLAVSDIVRTRSVVPYPGAASFEETRTFSRGARPVRAPRIFITGAAEDADPNDDNPPVILDDIEIYYVTFTIYDPSEDQCDPRFFDASNNTWYPDRGATFDLTFRLTSDSNSGFDFSTGSGNTDVTFPGGSGFQRGLTLVDVDQLDNAQCPNGNCNPVPGAPSAVPCDQNAGPGGGAATTTRFAVPVTHNQVSAFSPVE